MILAWLIWILLISGVLAWIAGAYAPKSSKWIALIGLLIDLILAGSLWVNYRLGSVPTGQGDLFTNYQTDWIPNFGISFHLGVDGLSIILLLLTTFLGLLSVLVSWKSIEKKVGFYYFNLLWVIAGIMGVFMAFDLFLFYLFWEVMLVPMYFLISIWGHENRVYASYKFFIFTQIGGLLMFLSILALYFIHGTQSGEFTFDYYALLDTNIASSVAPWLMAGFLIAFLIKLPAVPIHNWLPDAHTEAPTAGSVILAGLLLKTGAYGLIRFVIPFFPEAAMDFSIPAMVLGIIGILYGAKLAFAQTDMKRLVAYTSVSHMGFVLIGVFAFNNLAMQGVVMQLIAHGLSTGALFILVGMIQKRTGTRDINEIGGLWTNIPRIGGIGLLLIMASLGLPGLANFIAEFFILAGAFEANKLMSILGALGLIASSLYALRMMQKVFYGKLHESVKMPDINIKESIVMGSLIILLVYLGLYPGAVTKSVDPVINNIMEIADSHQENVNDLTKIEWRKEVENGSD